eukprot:TRINITY_DN43912_c0_g1_i1.p1 TRINITY_DN43912_c0_g1~~TRINITY_DN43912_c0_g1_i1.p1  ORF type:complete len:112 (-),score=8.80 TRINITY_DN43912_c0_g1_i1:112-447(-)
MKAVYNHSHWVWSTRYNPIYDSLVLSGGTDSQVNLWKINSLSSGAVIEDEKEKKKIERDKLISVFKDHGDSVYSVEWSKTDPWVYGSLSYDGTVALHFVPEAEKYKLLQIA